MVLGFKLKHYLYLTADDISWLIAFKIQLQLVAN